MTATDVRKILRRRHKNSLFVSELRVGCGYGENARSIDMWAIEAANSKGCRAHAYEIKLSRADFMRDMANPLKQRGARLYSDFFYFVAPVGIIKEADLPPWAGLIEIDETAIQDKWYAGSVAVEALPRSKERPSWPFVVSLLRRKVQDDLEAAENLEKKFETQNV